MLIIFEKMQSYLDIYEKKVVMKIMIIKYIDKTIFYLDFILLSFYSQFVIYLDEYLTLVIVYSYIEMDIYMTSKSWKVN